MLMVVTSLSACGGSGKDKYAGTWHSEQFAEEGTAGQMTLTLNNDGTFTNEIKGSTEQSEENIRFKVIFTAKVSGQWTIEGDVLSITSDPNSLDVEVDDMSSDNPGIDAILSQMLADPSTKQALMDEIKNNIDAEDFNGESQVVSISDDKMVLDEDGQRMTFIRG